MRLLKVSRTACFATTPKNAISPSPQLRCFSFSIHRTARKRFGRGYPAPGSLAEEFQEDREDDIDLEDEEPDFPPSKSPNLGKLGIRMLEEQPDGTVRRAQRETESEQDMAQQLQLEAEQIDQDFAKMGLDASAADQDIKTLFTQDQRDQLREEFLRAYNAGFFKRPYQIDINQNMSRERVPLLRSFNEAIERIRLNPTDDQARVEVWRRWERAKIHVPDFLRLVPHDVWKAMWQIQSHPSQGNVHRVSHLKALTDDMLEVGHSLSQEQRLARVEGLFVDGDENMALELWEEGLTGGDAGNPDYLELGIRMCSRMGNITRAEELLEVLFKLYTIWDPRIIKSIIFACIKKHSTQSYAQAFGLYIRLRERLTSDMSMEDYDEISTAFLSAGQKEYALAVFRDMICQGDSVAIPVDYSTITNRMGSFISRGKDAEEVNRLSLESLSILPRRFQNKYFYSSWMRKLIAIGQVDDAAQVSQLMWQRGVRPDAKHINGLVAAWFRTGGEQAISRAEQLAWSMIQSRLDFVRLRRRNQLAKNNFPLTEFDLPSKSIYDHSEGLQLPSLVEEPTPHATIETFSILVQWYLRHGKYDTVRHLRNLLVPAEIAMNSFIMNHLLYAEVRNRTNREVWNRFQVMSRTVTPDVETFACLWQCMKSHVDPSRNISSEGYPSPRELFARMRVWFAGLTGQRLRDAKGDMETAVYDNIIYCFCLARDLEGTFVALQALKDMWSLYAEPQTVRMVVTQIARINAPKPLQLGKPSRRKARQITASQANQDNMKRAAQILNIITQNRQEQLLSQGIKFEEMEPTKQAEEVHRTVLQLLYAACTETSGKSANASQAINDAASEMGTEEIDVDQAMALTV